MNTAILLINGLLAISSANLAAVEQHGPSSDEAFSHRFQWEAHRYDGQLNLHYGLTQPLLFNGFNAAADYRVGRWVLEYSHGTNLDYTNVRSVAERFLDERVDDAGLVSPWTTGFGVGYTLIDDLFVMLETKAHRYRTDFGGESEEYTTVSVGPALGYRLFLFRGLNLTAYLRYWPNVWDSVEGDRLQVGGAEFDPVNLGVFGNVSLGWAFDV